jgi:hypothetical protein
MFYIPGKAEKSGNLEIIFSSKSSSFSILAFLYFTLRKSGSHPQLILSYQAHVTDPVTAPPAPAHSSKLKAQSLKSREDSKAVTGSVTPC